MPQKSKAEVKEKFADFEYPIHVVGRHVAITDPMKSYAIDKLRKIDRFGGRVLEATVTMDIQKLVHTVDFVIDVNNTKIKVSGHTDNMYSSIDKAIAHLQAKLRRYMSRLHDHNTKSVSEIEMNVNVIGPIAPLDDINDQIEEENLKRIEKELRPHKVVSREKRALRTLNQEEAVMKMELSEDRFLIFRSEEDGKYKVIYRRNDNNYGIIELEK